LCDAVPALRDALVDEEVRNGRSYSDGADDGKETKGRTTRNRRGRTRGKSEDEKVDGRAGPRSENVVLSKCEHLGFHVVIEFTLIPLPAIEYIEQLVQERSALLTRFKAARSSLSPTDPALVLDAESFESSLSPGCSKPPPDGIPVPLWEREWSGGEGRIGDDDDEEDELDD
jgi:hypothetical protein